MKGEFRSFLVNMAELEVAGLMTAAATAYRFAEVSRRYAGDAGVALMQSCDSGSLRDRPGTEPASLALMNAHRNYLRQLAALPGWANMNFLSNLDRARSRR